MESVQYKGYTIQVNHYAAFKHQRREYPEVFDYVIFTGNTKVDLGYGFNSAEAAITNARHEIDRIIATYLLDTARTPDVALD